MNKMILKWMFWCLQHGGVEEGVCTTDGGCQATLDTPAEDKSKFLCAIHVEFVFVELPMKVL